MVCSPHTSLDFGDDRVLAVSVQGFLCYHVLAPCSRYKRGRKYSKRRASKIAASACFCNEFRFGNLRALQDRVCPRPSRLNMKRERDYRNIASVLLRLLTAPSRMV